MTTLFYPDVSHYQAGLSLAGAVACIAKATEGVTFNDRSYTTFKAQAQGLGIPFGAYHWLHASDVPGQARHAFAVVGPSVPLMIDDEDTGDGLSIPRTLAFVQAYRALGGVVTLEYLPRWFWAGHGSPDLRPLAAAGLSLISSNYTAYSDTGPGWNPYGGMTPAIWQYTSRQMFNGQECDFNAFKGTVDQLRALMYGGAAPPPGGDDMSHEDAQDGATLTAAGYDRYGNPAGAGSDLIAKYNAAAVEARLTKLIGDGFAEIKALIGAGGGGGGGPVDLTEDALDAVEERLDKQLDEQAD